MCTCNVRMYTCYNSLPNYRRDDVLVGPSDRSVCTPDMCGDDGSTRLGPVMAGSSYTCSVTASNAVGNSTSDTNTVITLTGKLLAYHHWISVYSLTSISTGIPSIPVVSVYVGGQVKLQVT